MKSVVSDALPSKAKVFSKMITIGTDNLTDPRSNDAGNTAQNKEASRLRAILAISRKLTSILDLDQLLSEAIRLIQDTFDYEVVTIYLRDQHDPNYFLHSHFTKKTEDGYIEDRNYGRMNINRGMVGWVFRNEQVRLANDVSQDPYYFYCTNGLIEVGEEEGEWLHFDSNNGDVYYNTKSELSLPIKVNRQIIGVLDFESSKLNAYDKEEIPFLQILADQIAIAIENTRLADRAREAAIAEERNRLARNLHDDTVQSLIGISRQMDLLRCDLEDEFAKCKEEDIAGLEAATPNETPDIIIRRLNRLQDSLVSTIQSLRFLSRELQPQLLHDLGLIAALDALAADVERTSGIRVRISPVDNARRLPDEQELEIYRIAQEAIANVLKHAAATKIELKLDFEADRVTMLISDNGKGFEVPQDLTYLARSGGMGVLSMRQRACRVGGLLTIDSDPGAGTTLLMEMPLPS